jgi:predicted nucleotidyltransferase
MAPQLRRLQEITGRLQSDPRALALLALGSVGRDTQRLDEHSDLDFFVIAEDKQAFLADLNWLGEPLQWAHRDTPDGCRALVAGQFHEFAVFTPQEMPGVRFEPGRLVWAREGFDAEVLVPSTPPVPDRDWLVREILCNLYVGLHRWLRGERLAALRMVQGEALDNLLRMRGGGDPFNPSRRAERRGLPLDSMAAGYAHTPAAAAAILEAIPAPPEDAMAVQVRELLRRCEG